MNSMQSVSVVLLWLNLIAGEPSLPADLNNNVHPIIPVFHAGDEEIHRVQVPMDTPIADLHTALFGSGYHGPTADDALENSEAFKKAAASLYANMQSNERMQRGGSEYGKVIDKTGKAGPLEEMKDLPTKGHLIQEIHKSDMGAIHTHDKWHQPDPSEADKEAAQKAHTTIWVVSRDGLYAVDPEGKVTRLYNSPDDLANKKKKANVASPDAQAH
jgi:hypothetical protein